MMASVVRVPAERVGGKWRGRDGSCLTLAKAGPSASLRDIYRASADVRGLAGSPGTVTLDPARDELVLIELADAEFNRVLGRAAALEDLAQRTVSRTVAEVDVI